MLILMRSSTGCNMRCDYCYGNYGDSGQRLNPEDCALLLQCLKREEIPEKRVEFLWHGGEPGLIGTESFAEMLELLNKLEKDGIEVLHSMQSNGLALADPWPELLRSYDVSVGISLDGPQALHDQARKLPDGSGTYAKIYENLQRLKDAGVACSLLCTLAPWHEGHEEEIVEWLEQVDLPVKFNPLFARGRSGRALPLKNYYALLRKLFSLLMHSSNGQTVQPFAWMLKAVLYKVPPSECSHSGKCGQNIFSFGKGGEIGICTRKQDSCGSLQSSTLSAIRQSPSWLEYLENLSARREACVNCNVVEFCNGGCPEVRGEKLSPEDCAATRDFFAWLKGPALEIYRDALVGRKKSLSRALDKMKELRATLEKSDV